MSLLGHKICKLERAVDNLLNLNRIRCDKCIAYESEIREGIMDDKPIEGHKCAIFDRPTRSWQFCDYFDKKPKPKNMEIETTCKNCENLRKSIEISKTTFSKKKRCVKWYCSSEDYYDCIPEMMWTKKDDYLAKRTLFDKVPKVESCCEFKTNKVSRFINNYRIWRN